MESSYLQDFSPPVARQAIWHVLIFAVLGLHT